MNLHDLPTLNAGNPPRLAGDAPAAWAVLHATASGRYRGGGRFAWHFARGKLQRDPVFHDLLQHGDIAPGARVLDIGCGQGLLASLLAACDDPAARRAWPAAWPAAPIGTRYTGIELMARDVARAHAALDHLDPPSRVVQADMRSTAFDACDVVVMLDVLHYVDEAAQRAVLTRVRDALAPRGRLLLRVGDASRRWAFGTSQWVDRIVTRVRGHRVPPTWGRTLEQWLATLRDLGFATQARPMSRGTPFANVLLVCDLTSHAALPR